MDYATQDTDQYHYEHLSPGEIRLLTLHPGQNDDPLRGTLDVYSLITVRPFEAISYAWGDLAVADILVLQHGHLPLTRSLQTSLRRFRHERSPRTLWVDQVCINQRNLSEQSYQVSIMSRIYSQAERVLVWLGESEASDVLAFWVVQSLVKNMPDRRDFNFYMTWEAQDLVVRSLRDGVDNVRGDLSCSCCNEKVGSEYVSALTTKVAVDALERLLSRLYFTRLWPVQEIALGESPQYYCGLHSVDFGSMYWAIELLAQAQISVPFFAIKLGQFSLLETAFRVGCSALETAVETMHFSCSEPRDRIFAIRPLTSEIDDAVLMPDYSMPVKELWRRTALCALQPKPHMRSSDAHDCLALALAAYNDSIENLSSLSWVPDLNANSKLQ